ncbi:glyoxalase/bleomycin resistance protein/dioxygenase superfamily protein [Raoultella ornithinolytica]|uniref:Glyoxalase/bleomycin resistance protein/dioxygenase superfamily protein n=1 Tax=Raoultella ornithinolytica TaxID=54291 RepID=A0ABD7QQ33_RAOOR|nr:glyoxalase/bleomycin resistance protein/dioxygenase superfamily protein [Raoultella ornithinolytica]
MTELRGVHSIDHFALFVPSLEEAAFFYDHFGLTTRSTEEGLQLAAADGHTWAKILPAERKSLAYISFLCFEQDYDALIRQVRASGGEPEFVDDVGFWFSDPDGNRLNVRPGKKTIPDTRREVPFQPKSTDTRGTVTRDAVKKIRPHRLSHVLLFSPDVPRAIRFYQQALGLNLSDFSQDIIAFMHARHGCDHHLVAFAKSSSKGFHHAAWEVDSIDDVGNGASQMAAAGYKAGWGTGRHCLGSNYFHYVRDPWGSFFEYSADIDFISANTSWPAGDFPPENSLYLWGPDVPPDFIHNSEA